MKDIEQSENAQKFEHPTCTAKVKNARGSVLNN